MTQQRKYAGLTRQQAAEKIGVEHPVIRQWEIGRAYPSEEELQLLSAMYEVSVEWLVGEKDFQKIPFSASYTDAEYQLIRRGLKPRVMENKWVIFMEGDVAHFHRSWTGECIFQLQFERGKGQFTTTLALVDNRSPNGARMGDEHEAELLHFLINNLLLGKSTAFPKPADLQEVAPGLYQHLVAGTGYPEREVQSSDESDTGDI